MIITKEMKYKELYFPTPRHRKMRSREATGIFTAEISETNAANAPVVLKVHDYVRWASDIQVIEYRWYGEQLYTLSRRDYYFNCAEQEKSLGITGEELAKHLHVCCSYQMVESDVAKHYQKEADDFLIIDGMAWRKSTEPFYEICTSGLGNNHGGTALLINTHTSSHRGENSFSALQEKEAREKAIEIALGRGDTKYVEFIKNSRSRIEILDPTVIRFHRDKFIFAVEKISSRRVFIKACSYAEALKLAKQIPDSRYSEDHVSYSYPAPTVSEEERAATVRPCFDEAAVAAMSESEAHTT